jgi:hypothetical protein
MISGRRAFLTEVPHGGSLRRFLTLVHGVRDVGSHWVLREG